MTNRDVCFLGLLALTYLYLDGRTSARSGERLPGTDPERLRAPGRPLEIRIVRREACPRNEGHPVTLRPDGAMWCRHCDVAYYPRAAEWEAGLAGAA